ncbi:uncharacterized protein METZ01_LOCUS248038 [marine metagenome]|uniref:Uncharacterized protein n=1 Tax=marine metagenome TaxID=408172 RepID=A0A382I655_9ZZZZ
MSLYDQFEHKIYINKKAYPQRL